MLGGAGLCARFRGGSAEALIYRGDVVDVLKGMKAASFDGAFCDPPYGLSFMGAAWDKGVPGVETWAEVLRVLKPGSYLLAFSSPRTQHRLACAIEDAGFEIRDCLVWLYGSGFPKAKSCLKPAYEPIILARKRGPMLPLAIDACRIGTAEDTRRSAQGGNNGLGGSSTFQIHARLATDKVQPPGRWPANVLLDAEAALALDAEAALALDAASGISRSSQRTGNRKAHSLFGGRTTGQQNIAMGHTDRGGASRFFYCAKASKSERNGNTHPTVKPLKLTEYLARLILPAGGGKLIVPFSGSGSEMLGAKRAGWKVTGIEMNPAYCEIAEARLKAKAA